jgi:hypothetical protein
MGTASKKNDIESSRWSTLRAADPTDTNHGADNLVRQYPFGGEGFAGSVDYRAAFPGGQALGFELKVFLWRKTRF